MTDPWGTQGNKTFCMHLGRSLRPIGPPAVWRGRVPPGRSQFRTLHSRGAQLSCLIVLEGGEVNVDAGAHRGR